jgi:signal transduction histidine kinase
MTKRQMSIFRAVYVLLATGAFWAAGRVLSQTPQQPKTGTLLMALGFALFPLCVARARDLGALRPAVSLNLLGLMVFAIILWMRSPETDRSGMGIVFVNEALALGMLTLVSKQGRPPESVYDEQIRQTAAQEERNRLARDLHDSIKQQIFAIQTGAAAVQARFDEDSAGAKEALAGVRSSAREAMTEMEAMLDQLRAAPLEAIGMIEAIRKQAEALEFRTGARVLMDFANPEEPCTLAPGAAEALFRIAQEAFSNIARHARATEVQVSMQVAEGEYVMRIQDNGSGFSIPERGQGTGMGLSNMRSRAKEQGGSLELESMPGEGTRLVAALPIVKPGDPKLARKMQIFAAVGAASAVISFFIPDDFFTGMARGIAVSMAIATVTQYYAMRRRR